MLRSATLVAQVGADPVGGALLQYGALGALALLSAIAVRTMYKRLTGDADAHRLRADRLEEELRKLNASLRDDCVKALTEVARVMSDTLVVLRRDDRRDR